MSRRFSSSFDSPVGVDAVYTVLTGEGWAATKAERLGDDSRVVRREEGPAGAVTVAMSRRLPAGVPGFLKKFLPSDQRVTTTDVWGPLTDGARHGTWTADIAGAPATMGGTMRIEPVAEGARYTIDGNVVVSVPLIGGKAESFIAEQVVKLAEAEAALILTVVA